MRPELNKIERIESYLSGSLNESEKTLFENELKSDKSLQEAVENQSLMVTAIERKALLAAVVAAAPPQFPPREGSSFFSKFKWPIILSSVVVGTLISWLAFRSDEKIAEKNEKLQQEKNGTIATKNTSIERSQDENATVDFTFQPTRTVISANNKTRFDGLETWIAPEVQKVIINPDREKLIECKYGTVILVPENAFVDANGNVINQEVTLEIIEALTMQDIVAYNLSTMSNGRALESGGMIYIQPKLNGKNVNLADGKSLHIEIPTDNYNPNMKAWEGVPDGKGNLNWENPQEIENYLIPVPISTLDFLPNGFREEVAATLPFKGHKTSSQRLEDSLYFSLGVISEATDDENKALTTTVKGNSVELSDPVPIKKTILGNINKARIYITNLPDRPGPYKVSLTQGGYSFTTTLERDFVTVRHYIGSGQVRVYSDNCSMTFDNLNFQRKTEYTLNCINMNCEGDQPSKSKLVTNNLAAGEVEEETIEKCYLDPSRIYAIYQEEFENTFIATREFQQRLQALHKIRNSQRYLDLYLTQLDRDLHEIDSQVASMLSGADKRRFELFARQKLTNVKPSGQNYETLEKYYNSKLKEQRQKLRKQRKQDRNKSMAELQAVQSEIQSLKDAYQKKRVKIQQKYNQSSTTLSSSQSGAISSGNDEPVRIPRRFRGNNARPQVGQQTSYKVNWYGTGWMNIDDFLHELSKGERIIPFIVKNDEGAKIYQSVSSLKTLLMLNSTDEGYNAHFPTTDIERFKNSIALGVRKSNSGEIEVTSQFFNPKLTNEVRLSGWEKVSDEEFKQRLKEMYPGGQGMLKGMEREEERIQRELERRKRAEEIRKKHDAELKELEKSLVGQTELLKQKERAIKKQQAAERTYVQHLENFINPCHTDFNNNGGASQGPGYSVMEVPGVVYFPDVEAQFPGGGYELQKFIINNVVYPQEAIDQGLQTTVHINCIVELDGSFSIVRVSDAVLRYKVLQDEALRVVNLMPKWIPASEDGRTVRSHVRIPVNFQLEE